MDIWRLATCGHGLHRSSNVYSTWAETRAIRTDVAEAAGPAVETDAAAVVGALVVAELVVPRAARPSAARSIVVGVADETVRDPRRPSTVHRRRVSDQYRLLPLAAGVDRAACTQPLHQHAACADNENNETMASTEHSLTFRVRAMLS